ncbi:MAG: UDP-N-acetylmuramoyl-L-alanine--D-glutamate ligase [Chitinophagaceae bacterium]|nr:UDP-N-acetylmuramoyl-L-alanine--D-glutamate ligase [Oligoflexus sp.]
MKRYLIVGAGRSALGACKLLLRENNVVTISDIEEKFPLALAEIRSSGAKVVIGPQGPELLDNIDCIVVSPGLSPKIPLLLEAKKRGLRILSEIDIALERFHGLVLGVTGTNGKSTTTLLLAHFLKASGLAAEASGNIGIAPSLILSSGQIPDVLVLELSSYQLDYSARLPNRVSLFMSFAPDHMERHGTLEAYFLAKWKLLMATDGLIVMPRKIIEFAKRFHAPVPAAQIAQIVMNEEEPLEFGTGHTVRVHTRDGIIQSDLLGGDRQFPMPLEIHNQLNAAAALVAAHFIRPNAKVLESLFSFQWLPYRFQKIGTLKGESVYNDSKSTNVESTEIALRSLEKPCILLLGGAPKGESYAPLLALSPKIHKLVTFGAAGPQIDSDLAVLNPLSFKTLKDALKALPDLMSSLEHPTPLVFSPANASFDEFNNFEERGLFFSSAINPLLDPQKS